MDVAVGPAVEMVVLEGVKREAGVAVASSDGARLVAPLEDARRRTERMGLRGCIFQEILLLFFVVGVFVVV